MCPYVATIGIVCSIYSVLFNKLETVGINKLSAINACQTYATSSSVQYEFDPYQGTTLTNLFYDMASNIAANHPVSKAKSTSDLTIAVAPPRAPHLQDSAFLTERQKWRRSEKEIVKRGFGGTITIDSDPCEASRHAHPEYLDASHWGDKDSRMVIWAKAYTHSA